MYTLIGIALMIFLDQKLSKQVDHPMWECKPCQYLKIQISLDSICIWIYVGLACVESAENDAVTGQPHFKQHNAKT